MKFPKFSFRWFLLGVGLIAIIGLTGMNVYSLYALHESTVVSKQENQKNKLIDFTNEVRHRFTSPLNDRFRLNTSRFEEQMQSDDEKPEAFLSMLNNASEDSLFSEVYFTDAECRPCEDGGEIRKYNPQTESFEWVDQTPEEVSDGITMARTNMSVLIGDYRWQTRIFFDTHRSLTIAIINSREEELLGFVNLLIDSDYLLESYLTPKISELFRPAEESGIVVWLHDWTQDEVLASTDESVPYDFQLVSTTQNFPDLLNNWNLKASFTESPTISASRATLIRNLSVLGATVVFLIGALVFMFITAQKERNLARRQAGFLANVTHELKTPLAVMQAAGENLADGRVNDESRITSYGRHIHNEAMRLRGMIEKLLDVAKADAGQMVLKPEYANLVDEINTYLQNKRSMIRSEGVKVDFQYDEPIPKVYIDRSSFDTIFGNLVENAIKYSGDEKYIGIRLRNTGKHLNVDVIDNGRGIPPGDQKYIFDKFYRVESSLTANTKGHGLGLSIVKDLTELNGGSVSVTSEENKGSTFTITFPLDSTNTNQTHKLNGESINQAESGDQRKRQKSSKPAET